MTHTAHAPRTETNHTHDSHEPIHVVCCHPPATLCGITVTDPKYATSDDPDRYCTFCRIASRTPFPCSDTCTYETRP